MVQNLVHDPIALGRKSAPAAKEDLQTAQDLLDTLTAHKDTCVGMAANMIGVTKRIIAFDNEGTYMVMLNPEIVKQSGSMRRRKAVFPCWAAREEQSGIRKSRCNIRRWIFRPA